MRKQQPISKSPTQATQTAGPKNQQTASGAAAKPKPPTRSRLDELFDSIRNAGLYK